MADLTTRTEGDPGPARTPANPSPITPSKAAPFPLARPSALPAFLDASAPSTSASAYASAGAPGSGAGSSTASPAVSPARTRAPSLASVRSAATTASAGRARLVSGSGSVGSERDKAGSQVGADDGDVSGEIYRPVGGTDVRRGLRRLVSGLEGGERGNEDGRDRAKGRGKGKSPVRSWAQEEGIATVIKGKGAEGYSDRRYYVLTNAGKPVYSSHPEEDGDGATNLMGVVQALVSIFAEDGDKLRSIQRGRRKISFLLRPPLYVVAISEWGEPDFVLRSHMEYIYLQILSVVTGSQLDKLFQRRSNFDLRRLVEGTDVFLDALIRDMQSDFIYLTSTLQPLRMTASLRDAAGAALVPPSKIKELLYVLLVADGKIVTLLRPRKHSIHPSDLHLVLNMLASSPALRQNETWLPLCLPKFNPAGFVYTFISYLRPSVGLVFLSADRDGFNDLREWKEGVKRRLEAEKVVGRIEDAAKSHEYSAAEVGFPGLRHFICKSRANVQITSPRWESPYAGADGADRKRLMTLYHELYDSIHARSGQPSPLKLAYLRTEQEACLAWITQPFELYLTIAPNLPKSAAVGAANAVARWVVKEESRLFLREAPVF